jgi:hypothetical protein
MHMLKWWHVTHKIYVPKRVMLQHHKPLFQNLHHTSKSIKRVIQYYVLNIIWIRYDSGCTLEWKQGKRGKTTLQKKRWEEIPQVRLRQKIEKRWLFCLRLHQLASHDMGLYMGYSSSASGRTCASPDRSRHQERKNNLTRTILSLSSLYFMMETEVQGLVLSFLWLRNLGKTDQLKGKINLSLK